MTAEINGIHGEGPIYPNGQEIGDEYNLSPDEWNAKYPPGSLPEDYEFLKLIQERLKQCPFKGYRPTSWHEMLMNVIKDNGGVGNCDYKMFIG